MTSRLFLGRLVSLLGRRRLMIVTAILSAASMAAIGQPLTMAWPANSAPPGLRGRAMSLRLNGNRLGQVVIPSAVGAIAASAGAAGVLWATAVALAAVAGLTRRLAADHVP